MPNQKIRLSVIFTMWGHWLRWVEVWGVKKGTSLETWQEVECVDLFPRDDVEEDENENEVSTAPKKVLLSQANFGVPFAQFQPAREGGWECVIEGDPSIYKRANNNPPIPRTVAPKSEGMTRKEILRYIGVPEDRISTCDVATLEACLQREIQRRVASALTKNAEMEVTNAV